ncbi:fucolectin-5-like [Dreissena polymorpha]|uniref:fucolectin-5-like n=1 Tax=Dreissena polymorpha TaxID=45954 RepID=UPI002263F97C|nr:fucolectin-5-like [Dreissena polymorpha]
MRIKICCGSSNESLSTLKQAEQSTTYRYSSTAHLAVDGNPSSIETSGNETICAHTNNQSDDWWMVDLGRMFQVTTVTIINRIDDCNCGGRLDGIVYEVGIATGSWEECGRFLGPGDGVVNITTTCDRTMHGRYVRIRKIKQDYLSLCEVYVYS